MRNYYKSINLYRPLIFLCGPLYDAHNPSDRRSILRDYIISEFGRIDKKNEKAPIPIIIDELLNTDEIKSKSLNISLLEEIIASISTSTYIFLDTLSTSFEFGLFANSNTTNQVKLLVPSKKPPVSIGKFIKDSALENKNVRYINYKEEHRLSLSDKLMRYVYFPKDQLPKEIAEVVSLENETLRDGSTEIPLRFQISEEFPISEFDINFWINDDLTVLLDMKMMFFLVLEQYRVTKKEAENCRSTYIMEIVGKLEHELRRMFVYGDVDGISDSDRLSVLLGLKRVKIVSRLSTDIGIIVDHILELIKLIDERILSNKAGAKRLVLSDKSVFSAVDSDRSVSLFDSFGFTRDDKKLVESYFRNPDKYIRKFTLVINGKKKSITTYKNNRSGQSLRILHQRINKWFALIFQTSNSAYAYKRGLNTKDCIDRHLNSTYFIKWDLSNFFGSLTLSNLRLMLYGHFSISPEAYFAKQILGRSTLDPETGKPSNRLLLPIEYDELNKVIKLCMYKKTVPIGFITSPGISDAFMCYFDKYMETLLFTYTRYADDILISSCKEFPDDVLLLNLETILERMGLELNKKKTSKKNLEHEGDSIRYLGINIVRRRELCEITISRQKLIDLSNEISSSLRLYYSGELTNLNSVKGKNILYKDD